MRITNSMMTNNMMSNINKNKNNLSVLDEQYTTGKKIQRPSQDPIIAVRALKLRTNLSELNQYYEKNIPDAKSWMEVTESALTNVNTILKDINSKCVQGANDSLTASDRTSIVEALKQYKEQIYQEGNSNYAGRYVFTGYKTNTSLSFTESTKDLTYTISESFTGEDLTAFSSVEGTLSLDSDLTAPGVDTSPVLNSGHKIRLSYNNIDGLATVAPATGPEITYTTVDSSTVPPTTTTTTVPDPAATPATTLVTKSSTDADAYTPGPDEIYFIKETGELIIGDNIYDNMKTATDISVEYVKKEFEEGDLRPEHYFKCIVNDGTNTTEHKLADQEIQYEINFNQKLTVNTQGKDSITHSIGRDIEEIMLAVKDVETVEAKIAEAKKKLEDTTITSDEKEKLNKLIGYFETELALKNDIMQAKFEKGITGSTNAQENLNVAIADLGSRYVRLELTESRLSSQQVEFEDLLSNNENADIAETYIKLSSAETIYTASLNAASKVVKNNLLDFL
ncbi:MAG: flagellar hook-associated protein FlgL [Anaerocolumna sp.]